MSANEFCYSLEPVQSIYQTWPEVWLIKIWEQSRFWLKNSFGNNKRGGYRGKNVGFLGTNFIGLAFLLKGIPTLSDESEGLFIEIWENPYAEGPRAPYMGKGVGVSKITKFPKGNRKTVKSRD